MYLLGVSQLELVLVQCHTMLQSVGMLLKNIGGNTHTGTVAIGGLALTNLSSGQYNVAIGYSFKSDDYQWQ